MRERPVRQFQPGLRRPVRAAPLTAAVIALMLALSFLADDARGAGADGAVADASDSADASGPTESERPTVLVTEVSTEITPVVADHIRDGIDQATSGDYAAYVIEMDTPGGLGSAMRDIIQEILNSDVPVIVQVAPEGARAASAGAIITLASHFAVMAPGTAIGAATPVGLQGEAAGEKAVQDAAAFAESLAERRDRNVDVARSMVVDATSLSASEAVEQNIVDAQAGSLTQALEAADGTTVEVEDGQTVTISVAGADVDRDDFGFFRDIQQTLANPNLAFILLTLGVLGLLFELSSPGVGIGGTVGAVSILLALFSLAVLPVNVIGVLLLLISAALFVAELFAPGIAGFAVGGAVTFALAAVFLFDDAEGVSVDPIVAVPTAVVVGILAIIAGRLVVRSQRGTTSRSGAGAYIGRVLTVDEVDDEDATRAWTSMEGSWWRLRSPEASLFEGERVEVLDMHGLDLVVAPLSPGWSPPEDPPHGRKG
ncbi:NfeD family protein [Phytoactinopolyspora halotolerans]|uniref:Nodulation protein NfeD n=1 Tax=Phytoactinopolyspora halotolerans TaxID=1981512 RepID=A0A6L9S3A5_9ACTN|nr:nodulation protein NfeD [Phytoactinopolyspora halotolerans]NED99051.1 nodulation protein NfeD [Phytoactinopolyspora halotolerans]